MLTEEIEEDIPIEKPEKITKKDKAITVRFTKKEKQIIDKTVKVYETSITELVRKAIFHYINMLNNNKDTLETQILKEEFNKFDRLKKALEIYEEKLNKFKSAISTLKIPNEKFIEFIEIWKKNNLK